MLARSEGKVCLSELDELLHDFSEPVPNAMASLTIGVRDALMSALLELDGEADLVASERMVADILREPRRIVREELGKLHRRVGVRPLRVGLVKSPAVLLASSEATVAFESPDASVIAAVDPELRQFTGFVQVSKATWQGSPAWMLLDRGAGADEARVEVIVDAAKKLAARVGVEYLLIPIKALIHRTNALARLAWKLDIPPMDAPDLALGGEPVGGVWELGPSRSPAEHRGRPYPKSKGGA